MTVVTLHRQAPVAPDATRCRLCEANLSGTFQDHVLVGQPGTSQLRAVVCEGCGQALARLVELCGPDLSLVVQDSHPSVQGLAGLPRTTAEPTSRSPASAKLESARQRLTEEADSLGRTERALRAEADRLSH
jgi:hypothetical protein